MKNKLKAELEELAHKIIEDSKEKSTANLKNKARELYEKLTVLAFAEENVDSLSTSVSTSAPSEKTHLKAARSSEKSTKKKAAPKEKDEYLPDGTEYNDADAITEPNTEKIKDIVAQMPPETQGVDNMLQNIMTKNGTEKKPSQPSEDKKDFRDVGVDYDNLPDFEPIGKQEKERPRSLNDRLKKGINIGLNERLSFIRYLFNGNATDYNRVISQLNTFDNFEEANKFVQLVVKPDYQNWEGKEEHEKRFMEHVENKFD